MGRQVRRLKVQGIRVQTLVLSAEQWQWFLSRLAKEYNLSDAQVSEALRFYQLYKADVEEAITSEAAAEDS